MKETLFVCLEEGNNSSYAAIMETFRDDKTPQEHLYPFIATTVRVNYGCHQPLAF